MPILIIWPLKMRTGRKIAAASPFYFQIPACAFVLVRVVYVHSLYTTADQTWAATSYQIWTSVNVHFSVIIANLPCIKVFLDGFNSSLWKGENFVSSGFTQAADSGDRSGRRISTKPKGFSKLGEEEERWEDDRYEYDYRPDKTHTRVTVVSQPSDARSLSDDGAIGKTTEWSVEHMPTERLVPKDYSRSLHDHTSGR